MFFLYTILIAVLVIIGFSLLYIYKSRENYFLVVRVYNVIEFALLAYFFSFHIRNVRIKIGLILSVFGYTIFCLYSFLRLTKPEMPFVPASVAHIVVLIIIIFYFFEVMKNTVVEPIYLKPIFWICVAFIINSSGNFFLFLYSKNSYGNEDFQRQYIIIYATVTVIKNLILCISISIKDKVKKDDSFFDLDSKLDKGLSF